MIIMRVIGFQCHSPPLYATRHCSGNASHSNPETRRELEYSGWNDSDTEFKFK